MTSERSVPSRTPSVLHKKSKKSPLRHVVRYAWASSMRPPIAMGHSNTADQNLIVSRADVLFLWMLYICSIHMTTTREPYMTKCVHLSIMEMSLRGVSGTGMRHTTHIARVSRHDSGYLLMIVFIYFEVLFGDDLFAVAAFYLLACCDRESMVIVVVKDVSYALC